ncbi:MAG: primosomal protein N' [Elusimicrobia bacterium]|nr:primosomal protein N' [Candidatus Liberimonas magnetica]
MFAEIYLSLPVDKPFHYEIPEGLADKARVGMRSEVPFGSRKVIGFITKIVQDTSIENVKPILSLYDNEVVLTEKMFKLAEWLSQNYMCSYGEALSCILPASIRPPKRPPKPKDKDKDKEMKADIKPVLNVEQQDVTNQIIESAKQNKPDIFCLHGITSSGKTEVYLNSIEEVLKLGKSAIYLLPEISLTPQFISIVENRFPGLVGVWHSRLSAGKRYLTWEKARKAEIKILLGARSCIFAPFTNLGLIIMDEEHEPTYKQDQKPQYQTREIVDVLAKINNAVAVFGSATPSLEVYYRAKQGQYKLLEMNERVDKRELPKVTLVDVTQIPSKARVITKELALALTRILARREQAIVFLNRRGFSPGVSCPKCGNVWQCPRCSVSLVYHKTSNDLRCHYCGYTHPWPGECPTCKNKELSVFGIGTQKVEQELHQLFPQARVFRLDRDTASSHEVYHRAYQEFKNENYDILLGTQMVAKGFDFPRVTLVGVIDADTALYLPDFRSAERTFQLITQVAGRSGRSSLGGEVIVQTRYPNHYALLASKDHDYHEFYDQEINNRRQMDYPPFSRLANILVRASKEEKAIELINKISGDLNDFKEKNVFKYDILGPTPAAHSKLRRLFRWQVLLKGNSEEILLASKNIRNYYIPRGIFVSIDIDPQNVL